MCAYGTFQHRRSELAFEAPDSIAFKSTLWMLLPINDLAENVEFVKMVQRPLPFAQRQALSDGAGYEVFSL